MRRGWPLTQSSQTALKLYLEQARTAFASQPGQIRLFVSSRSGGPLDVDDIRRIVRKWTKNANIKKNVTPHTMRHSCATHLLKGRADIRQIQKLLGHRRLSSTEIYTHVELGDLAEVISRCHPREKKRSITVKRAQKRGSEKMCETAPQPVRQDRPRSTVCNRTK
ncbi:MAG: tyrosine-type recombinase/integrase [Chloracidobacterium sp.]|nr:tyrosine-type recombinase/integrase [Chloracidobacterium sp.]